MSKKQIDDEMIEDNSEVLEEVKEEDLDTIDENVSEEDYIDDEELKKDLEKLDEGNLPLLNEEKMGKLLTYLLSKDKFIGEFNETKTAKLVESMIHDIKSVDSLPDDAVIGVDYTAQELETISKNLMRYIQASQHKRNNLSRKELNEKYQRLDDPRLILSNEETQLLSYITSALALLDQSPTKDSFKDGEWTNILEHSDKRIGTALVVNYKDPVKQVRSKLNLLNEVATQLVHSGMVVKLASAGSLDQALLNDNLVAAKIDNSLTTYGTGFDMTSIYVDEILVDHIHRQLIDTNVGDMSKESFEENLSILDLNTLYNALALSLHPTGFKLYRQCLNDECNNIDEEIINPRRTILYREDKLTQQNKQHLVRGFAKTEINTIKEYRETLNPELSKYHQIGDETYLKFKIPSFAEYKRISKHWIEYLGDKSMELVRGSMDEESRRRYVQQAMHKASVMMYAHWVDGIYTRDENGDYNETMVRLKPGRGVTSTAITAADEALDLFLADLSLNREVHNNLVTAITDFIRDSTLAVTVLAKSKCTKCNSPYIPEGDDIGDELIGFNAGELFFILLHRKTGEL